MPSRADDLSPAHLAALRALTDVAISNDKMVVELARTIPGIELRPPYQPRTRTRHRYTRIERPERRVVLATAVGDITGQLKHLRITKDNYGTLDVEELEAL